MNFASSTFLIFLLVVLLLYHLTRQRAHRYAVLLAGSWVFYMSWNPWLIVVLWFVTIVNYGTGRLIDTAGTSRQRFRWLLLGMVCNLTTLGFFKYTTFLLESTQQLGQWLGWDWPAWGARIALPLGISFFTFQGISYIIDVYQRKLAATRSFLDFAMYLAFFPQLVSGPIVRASQFLPQMTTPPRVTARQVVEGLHWFLLGMIKKVFIADQLALFVDPVFAAPGQFDAATHRWAMIAYAAQIYCDFSGYSDIAMGCAKWFGFELPVNFRFPYVAGSITDFWRRWHISLGNWIKDYLYIPLGGNRQGSWRTYANLITAMTLCGLWHGASWTCLVWGFYNGVLLSAHRVWDRALQGRVWADHLRGHLLYRMAAIPCTFLLVLVGLVCIRAESWPDCWLVTQSLVGVPATTGSAQLLPAWTFALVALVAAGHLLNGWGETRCRWLELPPLARGLSYSIALSLLIIFAPVASKPFIYFQY
ncbi:MAG: MBOAT family O-acyltransferase [Gemmataceae bacterium]